MFSQEYSMAAIDAQIHRRQQERGIFYDQVQGGARGLSSHHCREGVWGLRLRGGSRSISITSAPPTLFSPLGI